MLVLLIQAVVAEQVVVLEGRGMVVLVVQA
jgi:hypothetical protein